MFWIRLYELVELAKGHQAAYNECYMESRLWYQRPGFLNAVNNYYGYRVWR